MGGKSQKPAVQQPTIEIVRRHGHFDITISAPGYKRGETAHTPDQLAEKVKAWAIENP